MTKYEAPVAVFVTDAGITRAPLDSSEIAEEEEPPLPNCTSRPDASSLVTLNVQGVDTPPTVILAVKVSPTARSVEDPDRASGAVDTEELASCC